MRLLLLGPWKAQLSLGDSVRESVTLGTGVREFLTLGARVRDKVTLGARVPDFWAGPRGFWAFRCWYEKDILGPWV